MRVSSLRRLPKLRLCQSVFTQPRPKADVDQCLLSGVKQTWLLPASMPVNAKRKLEVQGAGRRQGLAFQEGDHQFPCRLVDLLCRLQYFGVVVAVLFVELLYETGMFRLFMLREFHARLRGRQAHLSV
jgi:hypothetical protein